MEYAEGQIRRLLSGQVELWELPLTGGLWRVTGENDNLHTCKRTTAADCRHITGVASTPSTSG